jgi:transcriptional regulator with XRE-family HTH domain
MTPADFAHWRATLGISQAEAARRLQCSKNSMTSWLTGRNDIPYIVGLACAALAAGLPPYAAPTTTPTKKGTRS